MLKKLVAAWLCAVLLSACSPITINTEELLVPPRLNQRQAKVQEALEDALNLGNILYKYPQRGEERSPFVFYDLDRDGREEAVVFYSLQDDADNVRAMVLQEYQDGSWAVVHDLAGNGDQVDFIQFANILSSGSQCMVVGWQNSRLGTATLSVYAFEGNRFNKEMETPYADFYLGDFSGDGLSQLVVISQDSSGYLLTLYRAVNGQVAVAGSPVPLAENINSILQICVGRLWNGSWGIYVDELRIEKVDVATEIVEITPRGLVTLVGERQPDLYEDTARRQGALSSELLGDGAVLIPTMRDLPGDDGESELEPPELTDYLQLTEDGFVVACSAVRNEDDGYLVMFPERWVDQVTVRRRWESSEWQFYRVDESTDRASVELLRIVVYSTEGYRDRFTTEYILLAEKGMFQYYADIRTAEDPLSITQHELEEMFALI